MAKQRKPETTAGFRLEVLNARNGDALFLHGGSDDDPVLIVIDGGPPGTYKKVIQPRIEALRPEDGCLPIRLLMVTHIDGDHIAGVLELARDLDKRVTNQIDKPFWVKSFWYNSFGDLVGSDKPVTPKAGEASAASLTDSLAGFNTDFGHGEQAEASVKQGVELRDLARKYAWKNNEFPDKLLTSPTSGVKSCMIGNLKLTILGPSQARIDKLQAEWNKALTKADRAGAAALVSDASIDTSVTNLSSIIVLAEYADKRMLLTGDALGLHVIDGLKNAGFLDKDDRIHVDLLKLPHHGSDRNNNAKFFQCITADNYVISADGRDGNPDERTFRQLVEIRGEDEYTIHLTNDHDKDGKAIEAVNLLRQLQVDKEFKINLLPAGSPSLLIDLMKGSQSTRSSIRQSASKPARAKAPRKPKPPA